MSAIARWRRLGGDAAEGVDGEDADAVADLGADRRNVDDRAGDGDVERPLAARADDGEAHAGAGIAAHPVDRLVERAAVEEMAVDMGDEVARLDAGAVGRGAAGRRDHLDRAVLHRDGEAEPAIIAVGRRHQRAEAARVEIGAVRIEAGEHAVDRAADQLSRRRPDRHIRPSPARSTLMNWLISRTESELSSCCAKDGGGGSEREDAPER